MCVIRTYNLRNRNTSRTLSDKGAGKKPKSLDTHATWKPVMDT